MRSPLTVRTALIKPLIDTAAAEGLRAADILKIEAGQDRVRLADYFSLQQALAHAVEDETYRLSSRQLLPGTLDFVLSRLSGATSLYAAMKALATHFNLLHGGEYNSVLRRTRTVVFRIDDRKFPYTLKDDAYLKFTMECLQIFLHAMLATISEREADAGLRRVCVTRAAGGPDAAHLAFWRAPIKYGSSVYAVEYDAATMAKTVAAPPPEMLTASRVYQEVVALIDARERDATPTHRAAALVAEGLKAGAIDQKKAAALLGVSVATLRRRLAAEGVSFRTLRKDVLNGEAQSLLLRRRPIADVAEALGFADFRSFNRAFREWNGETPKAFASRARGAG